MHVNDIHPGETMTLLDALSTLPPDAELTLTVEQLREMLEGGEETPQGFEEHRATIDKWVRRCTENYTGPESWRSNGDGPPGRRE